MARTGFIQKLKDRWQLKSGFQVIIVLIVFACTGFTVLFLKRPVMHFIDASEQYEILFSIIYYILILPIYQILLLGYAFIFGQFKFFWEFEKKMFRRMFVGTKK
ncbi:prolipoprotein diacylglyceryl transferase [Fulvivirgaceae bacterium BMA10]|uniref:Prolipoprotein diacylglyceryl transferase n=1 Tax=Splendidivirga corallicola TaxID=3051826 RepID=A0ABT8KIJ8_9BACT|nr:prolipoprotein diacylglyceryl transferase [Fulvivirgaceae bacterium BMA10]